MGKCGNPATQEIVLQITYFRRYYCYCLFLLSFITYGVSQFIIVLPLHLLSHCMFNTPPALLFIYYLVRLVVMPTNFTICDFHRKPRLINRQTCLLDM